ncbi:autotransporter domain-containing protein [Pseudomonas sp. FEN]|uniref:autotransporter outer membrane beta-barrel domain-containing protein n=1 Tax=Pseudomonas sp. FEN TaxID=2767468 RepID=UPI00174B663D|nr:autotransporter outer membrane beta-barrel domain-containing protein [Pseudomonas sp. FEN]
MPLTQHRLGWAVALALGAACSSPVHAFSRETRGDTLYVEHLGNASSIMASEDNGIFTFRQLSLKNDGAVKGLSGSGVYAHGNGVVRNWGSISGHHVSGVSLTEYNGVRIGRQAHIENHGTIEADLPNRFFGVSSGLSMGSGSVVNAEDALIRGPSFGILGKGHGPVNVANHGVIRGHQGIKLGGRHDDSVTNHGLIESTYGSGTAIDLGGGHDKLTLYSGSRVVGIIEGGSGLDELFLKGDNGTLAHTRNFEFLTVNQGTWTLAGPADFSSLVRVDNGATLINHGGIRGFTSVDSAGVYSGSGSTDTLLVKGTLVANPRSGAPIVERDLTLAGSATLAYGIDRDGGSSTLEVGGTAYLQGATLVVQAIDGSVPVTSAHTVLRAENIEGAFHKVSSDLAFMTYRLSYSPTDVGLIYSRNYVPLERFAESGNARSVAASLGQTAYFAPAQIEPMSDTHEASANAGRSTRVRRSLGPVGGALVAAPDEQSAVAMDDPPANPLGVAEPPPKLVSALLASNAATARKALNQLAGSHNANLGNATLSGVSQVGGNMLSAMRHLGGSQRLQRSDVPATAVIDSEAGVAKGRLWVQGLGNSSQFDRSPQNAQAMQQQTRGVLIGADWALDADWRLGIVGGQSRTRLDGRDFKGTVDSWHLGAYALRQRGPLAIRLGAVHSHHDGNTQRTVAFDGFSERLRGNHDASSQQVFSEFGYTLGTADLSVEPFVGLGYQRYHRQRYTENGGDSALRVRAHSQDDASSTVGARLARQHRLDNGMSLTPRASVGWKHRYGRDTHSLGQSSTLGGGGFEIRSARLDRDSLVLDAGLDLRLSGDHSMGVGYTGEIADNRHLHAVQGEWRLRF